MATFISDQSWVRNDLDHSSVATLLARCLQSADYTNLKPFGQGDFCLAFKLGNQVVRVARHLEAAAALRRETCILAEIAAMLPLPVPRPAYHSPRECLPFTVHDEVVGKILTRDDWKILPTVARVKAASDLATFLRVLHSLPIEIGQKCGLALLDSTELARSLREATPTSILEFLDHETQRRLDETLKKWSLPSLHTGRHPVLLHCDIAPGHLLYDPLTGGLTGVIDFGDIAIGDPARDFIYIYEDYGQVILEEVLYRYAGKDAPKMMSAIRKWYLLETISWTVAMSRAQPHTDIDHGLDEITRELATPEVQ